MARDRGAPRSPVCSAFEERRRPSVLLMETLNVRYPLMLALAEETRALCPQTSRTQPGNDGTFGEQQLWRPSKERGEEVRGMGIIGTETRDVKARE